MFHGSHARVPAHIELVLLVSLLRYMFLLNLHLSYSVPGQSCVSGNGVLDAQIGLLIALLVHVYNRQRDQPAPDLVFYQTYWPFLTGYLPLADKLVQFLP